jgi:hypothetical protein
MGIMKFLKVISLILLTSLLVIGCGDGDSVNVDEDLDGFLSNVDNCPDDFNPDQADLDGDGLGDACDTSIGSTITITGPDNITDITPSTSTDTAFFAIVVKNQSGVPLANVEISITYPWAVPNPAALVQLFDGNNTQQDSPMSVTTDANGTFNLRMDYQRGLVDYTGTIQVTSGSVIGTADFSVSSE